MVHRLRHQQVLVPQRVRRPAPLLNLIRHIQTQRRVRPERQLLELARHVALLRLRQPLLATNVLELAPMVGLLVCRELELGILLKQFQMGSDSPRRRFCHRRTNCWCFFLSCLPAGRRNAGAGVEEKARCEQKGEAVLWRTEDWKAAEASIARDGRGILRIGAAMW
jgi:hypothetical protein